MLQSLYISNFVLIDQLQMDFKEGFSTFIGETGAGKSILMDAISLVCGERGTSDVVRHGETKAVIEATFDINEKIKLILDDAGIDYDDSITLTREIYAEGKNICRVNRRVCNVGLLKEIGSSCVMQHSQYDTSFMRMKENYLLLLDTYVNDNKAYESYKELYDTYQAILKEKKQFYNENLSEDEIEMIQYNVDEIDKAHIEENELEELEEKIQLLQASEQILQACNEAIENIEGENGFIGELYNTARILRQVKASDKLCEISEKLDSYYYEIKDAASEISNIIYSVQEDGENFNALQERAFLIRKLFRKHGGDYASMMEYYETCEQQLLKYSNKAMYEKELLEKEKSIYDELLKQADVLHDIRQKHAKILEKELLKQLIDLNLKNTSFQIEFTKVDIGPYGYDDVVFKASMNKGESLRPLMKCASGGELSRFMLGLKVVYKNVEDASTIIFDEIDTGISGQTAYTIGSKMRELSANTQVFSVTHLAQVAAYGTNIYYISKEVKNNQTVSKIHELKGEEVYEKLALIATGSITPASIQAAKEVVETTKTN